MRKQDFYTYTVIKDIDRNLICLIVRYRNEKAILIPMIDIFLLMEKMLK